MNSRFLRTAYSFPLPEEFIASQPLAKRDEARLLVVHRKTRSFEHKSIRDLPQYLQKGDVVVANNTRVFRARLLGEREKTGGKVEFFLLKPVGQAPGEPANAALVWQGLMKTGARIAPGFRFQIPEAGNPSSSFSGLAGEVIARDDTTSGAIFTARFSKPPLQAKVGEVPLPPYIMAKRNARSVVTDAEAELRTYNTVFAQNDGSVAAPTAGRHFTRELIQTLREKGITWNEITLHVGLGTFKPVMVDDIREHEMHPEQATISAASAALLNQAKQNHHRILTVGTTTTRALEGSVGEDGKIEEGTRDVNLFIYPGSGHLWRVSDALLTNFHLPESTLLMMVASFLEQEQPDGAAWLLELYQEAIREKYRFYSYGDAMLIL